VVASFTERRYRRMAALLAYGCNRRDLARNVAASMKKVPRVRQKMQTYTPDEIGKVLATAEKDRNGHLWHLAFSGLGRGATPASGGMTWT